VNAQARNRVARFLNNTAFGKTRQARPAIVLLEDQSLRKMGPGAYK
jgi:hypothetical protein